MSEIIYGKSPVHEAFRAQKREIHRFFYQKPLKPDSGLEAVLALAQERGVPSFSRDADWFRQRFPGVLTQGWAAELAPYPYDHLREFKQRLNGQAQSIVLALDQIQDPQNLGAILRTAECCGVQGVLFPEKRSSPVTAVVCKASAGATEYLDICRVPNLVQALKVLKKEGFWVVGTSTEQAEDGLAFQWPEKTVLVLGSEGKGMRRLVRESCDFLIHLPLAGRILSLNVATTAAVFLYQIIQSRR